MKRLKFFSGLTLGIAASILLNIGTLRSVRASEAVSIQFGSVVTGRLESGNNQLPADGSYYNAYTFEGQAGQRIQVTMSSDELDSYLILLDVAGNSLIQNDDGGDGLDAQIVYTLPESGRYTIYANAHSSGQTGAYRLELLMVDVSTSAAVEPRYFCDESGRNPVIQARRKDGVVGSLIEWTSDTTPANISRLERCRRVASNLETNHSRLGRSFAITAGTLQGQPVVCAGTAPGICDPEGQILLAATRDEARRIAIELGTGINALQNAPTPIDENDTTPLAVVPQFNFLDILSYSNCVEDVIQLYQNPERLRIQGRRSDCLSEVFAQYPNGISRSQALEILAAADQFATSARRDALLYPPRGQRVRIREIFGYTYSIDQQ
ncbi:COP23 domain-containing protein [Egbenema bharatensis]|uniref:COP23 domain-containing protein n=1 Tax=Egbenema bharatensis TaxID=3463334 RepID=UPI003A8C13C9